MWRDFLDRCHTDADVLIAAGDMFSLKEMRMRWTVARLQELGARYKHVFYLPGNHEFYGTSIHQGMDQLLTADRMDVFGSNVHVLHTGKVIEVDGQRFLGDTGWFPVPPDGAGSLKDHYRITALNPDAYIAHREWRAFLDKELRKGDIVVSHHLPSDKSIDPKYAGDSSNAFFSTPNLEYDFIIPREPDFWIHGHTHCDADYFIGPTRVLCKPHGYLDERSDPNLTFTFER